MVGKKQERQLSGLESGGKNSPRRFKNGGRGKNNKRRKERKDEQQENKEQVK